MFGVNFEIPLLKLFILQQPSFKEENLFILYDLIELWIFLVQQRTSTYKSICLRKGSITTASQPALKV